MFKIVNILVGILFITESIAMDTFRGIIERDPTNENLKSELIKLSDSKEKDLARIYIDLYIDKNLQGDEREKKLKSIDEDEKRQIFSAARSVLWTWFYKSLWGVNLQLWKNCEEIGDLLIQDDENVDSWTKQIVEKSKEKIKTISSIKWPEIQKVSIPEGSFQFFLHDGGNK